MQLPRTTRGAHEASFLFYIPSLHTPICCSSVGTWRGRTRLDPSDRGLGPSPARLEPGPCTRLEDQHRHPPARGLGGTLSRLPAGGGGKGASIIAIMVLTMAQDTPGLEGMVSWHSSYIPSRAGCPDPAGAQQNQVQVRPAHAGHLHLQ